MKRKKRNYDHIIDEAIRSNIEHAPPPPISKEETWRLIQQKIQQEKQVCRRRNYRWVMAASIMFIIILTSSMFTFQDTGAFSWFTQQIKKIQGTDTHIQEFVGEQDPPPSGGSGDLPEQDEIVIHNKDTSTVETMSISELQEIANFPIRLPTYIPAEYNMNEKVTVKYFGEEIGETDISFDSVDGTLLIRQSFLDTPGISKLSIDHEDTMIKDIKIHGNEGQLYSFKDGSTLVRWSTSNLRITISSYEVSAEEMLKIAESM